MSLYVSLLSFFLGGLIIIYNRKAFFLGLLIIILTSYVLTLNLLLYHPSRFWVAVFYNNLAPFWYLAGPFFYFYVRNTIESKITFYKKDLIHFIPFFISLIGILPYLLTSFEYKLTIADSIIQGLNSVKQINTNWIVSIQGNLIMRPILLIGYTLFCIRMILNTDNPITPYAGINSKKQSFPRKWLLVVSTILIINSIPSLFLSILYTTNSPTSWEQIKGGFFSEMINYVQVLFPLSIILYSQIIYGDPKNIKEDILKKMQIEDANIYSLIDKKPSFLSSVSNPAPSESKIISALALQILTVLRDTKPYLNHDFSLDDLAKLMNTPKHHLYFCFKNELGVKFTDLRTKFRIEYAKQLLKESDLQKVTLDSVGRDSGFASKSGFYKTFKDEVGCSPGEYADENNVFISVD